MLSISSMNVDVRGSWPEVREPRLPYPLPLIISLKLGCTESPIITANLFRGGGGTVHLGTNLRGGRS